MLFKKKNVGVYFKVSKKLKKKLDLYLIQNELKLNEYFNALIKRELKHAESLDKWADNMNREIEELI